MRDLKRKRKNFLAYLLASIFLLNLIPTAAFAAPPTITDPYMESQAALTPEPAQNFSELAQTVTEPPEPVIYLPEPEPVSELPYDSEQGLFDFMPYELPVTQESMSTPHPFPDIAGHWAENAVMYCNDRGIINVYPNGQIWPDEPMSREEFAYSLSKWMDINSGLLSQLGFSPSNTSVNLSDVAGSQFQNEINNVASKGLMSGDNSSFRPYDNLTREEASSVWTSLFRRLTNCTLDEAYFNGLNAGSILSKYSDSYNIAEWARQSVAAMTDQRFLTGYPNGEFRPKGVITRAEAYTIISKIELKLKDSLQPVNYTEPNDMKLVRIFAKNIGTSSFDAELTVNNVAVSLNPDVILAYTTNGNIDINENNIGTSMSGVTTRTVRLSDLRNISTFAYQSVYSTNISASFPNTYYVYAMLKKDNKHTDVKNCVIRVDREVVHENYPYYNQGYGRIVIDKVNVENSPLSGAVFELRNSGGYRVTSGTSGANGRITFDNLALGEYRVVETSAPSGYINSGYQNTVTLTDSYRERYLTVTNQRMPNPNPDPPIDPPPVPPIEIKGSITVNKLDELTLKPLGNATFELRDGSNILKGQKTTSGNGIIVFDNLAAGTYKVKETDAPAGYNLDSDVRLVTLTAGDPHKSINVYNRKTPEPGPDPKGKIEVIKIDAGNNERLTGAEFLLTKADGTGNWTRNTSDGGIALFDDLDMGTYVLRETNPPDGYKPKTEPITIELTRGRPNHVEYVENTKILVPPSITIEKVDRYGNPLVGAVFEITYNGTPTQTWLATTPSSGTIVIDDLTPGNYTICELTPPPGYRFAEPNEFMFNLEAGEDVVHRFENDREETGPIPPDKEIKIIVPAKKIVEIGYIDIPEDFVGELVITMAFDNISGSSFPDLDVQDPNGNWFGYLRPYMNSAGPTSIGSGSGSCNYATYNGYFSHPEVMRFVNPTPGRWFFYAQSRGGSQSSGVTFTVNQPAVVTYDINKAYTP